MEQATGRIWTGGNSKMSDEKPYAALLRENGLLRSVAAKALRLRRIGMHCDELDTTMTKIWEENPEMSKSGTHQIMMEQAFKTAMDAFDAAVLRAADEGMDWAKDHGIPKPALV
jgi:hypothetical protein